jgi:hypothetical protein
MSRPVVVPDSRLTALLKQQKADYWALRRSYLFFTSCCMWQKAGLLYAFFRAVIKKNDNRNTKSEA